MSADREKAFVITVSDRSARGERVDLSGPKAVELLESAGFEVGSRIISDGAASVEEALKSALANGATLIVTTGGTGVTSRDRTPEGTRAVIDFEIPGFAELLRLEGAKSNPLAVLSRGVVGVASGNRALVVNLPGSVSAVEQGLGTVLPLVPHVLDQLRDGDH
ncbi:MAG: MogA/MoaB family molybdenum cofactor biosynthesis protein [Microbacteriaceae bacterium]|nr:MogA/MoaB family molybdenum cofactor biosynthesis protein [Microbacteriaceae bacterium]